MSKIPCERCKRYQTGRICLCCRIPLFKDCVTGEHRGLVSFKECNHLRRLFCKEEELS